MERPPLSRPLVLAVAAVAGAATMVVELAAVRLLAPWFGTSQTVCAIQTATVYRPTPSRPTCSFTKNTSSR